LRRFAGVAPSFAANRVDPVMDKREKTMRILQLLAIAVLSLALFANHSRAQQPDILGTWSAEADRKSVV
jgi:hypothetical protein